MRMLCLILLFISGVAISQTHTIPPRKTGGSPVRSQNVNCKEKWKEIRSKEIELCGIYKGKCKSHKQAIKVFSEKVADFELKERLKAMESGPELEKAPGLEFDCGCEDPNEKLFELSKKYAAYRAQCSKKKISKKDQKLLEKLINYEKK